MDRVKFLAIITEASTYLHRAKRRGLTASEHVSLVVFQTNLIQEIVSLKEEIAKIELASLKFALQNTLFFLSSVSEKIIKLITPACETRTAVNSLTDLICHNLEANAKMIHEKGLAQVYLNPRLELSYLGMLMITHYYNQKYFACNPSMMIIPSHEVCLIKIRLACQQEYDFRYGFISFTTPQDISSKEASAHPIPIILERFEDELYLFISDSSFHENNYATSLYFKTHLSDLKINYLLSKMTRQADNGSCRTDALVFLKNTLQSPKGLIHTVTLGDRLDARTSSYLDSADMLKTSQKSKNFRHLSEDAKLYSTKKKLGFFAKIGPYQQPTLYLRQDLITHQDFLSKAGEKMIEPLEHSYLLQKNWRHHQILENFTTSPDFFSKGLSEVIAFQESLPRLALK